MDNSNTIDFVTDGQLEHEIKVVPVRAPNYVAIEKENDQSYEIKNRTKFISKLGKFLTTTT